MIEKSIKKALSKLDGVYKFNNLLTFMEESGINFINRRLAGPLAIATLDGVIIDILKLREYSNSLVYFIFIHEIAHMKRINKLGKEWFLGQLSITDRDMFISEICKEEVIADRYACRMFYKLNNIIYPWSATQQLNLPQRQINYAPLIINGYYLKINNDEETYRKLIQRFIIEKKMIKINDILEGSIKFNAGGSAYLVSPDLPKDIYLNKVNTGKALHLDTVKIRVIESNGNDRPFEGEVIEIVERFKTEFVGVIQKSSKFIFFISDNRKILNDFFIPKDKSLDATDGQKVIVKLTEWGDKAKNPNGEVIKILGNAGEHETEIHSILEEYGLPYDFNEEVLAEARAIPIEIPQAEIDKRRDMRDVITFTIDPADAKDFDDAISVEWVNGELFVGIHIADVSHYLRPDTDLDKEAYARGTSVYLVDRCVPMLPENLSNGLCSLRPLEDKLCFSAVFKLDHNGTVLEEWFGKTVINSNHRFTYEQAQDIIEAEKGSMVLVYKPMGQGMSGQIDQNAININKCYQAVRDLNKLAQKMRKARQKTGALSFDKQEVKFDLDENNKPVGIKFKTAKDSNKLIEEFMLLANKQVAQFINKKQLPNVNRSHDKPNETKLEALRVFIKQFGYDIQTNTAEETTKSLNELLNSVQGTPEADMIDNLVVRTMQKATYSTKNIGHYGLGFKDYSHFTSPIRRYPDVIIHRLLALYLDTERVSKTVPKLEKLEGRCVHLSEREKKAQKAERDSIKYMQCVYMADNIGKVYEGIVSSVMDFGIFVTIPENGCDALLKLSNIKGTWQADTTNYRIKEHNTQDTIRLGDTVNVVITAVDLERKSIDCSIIRL